MSDSSISVPNSGTAPVDTESLTVNSMTVNRQRIQLAGNAAAAIASVKNGAPTSTDYGLVVRNVGADEPTFQVAAVGIATANGKSMFAIQNTAGSAVMVKVKEIYLQNVGTTAVTGVLATIEMRRCTSFTGGTALTPAKYDTADSIAANVQCATNATITGESADLIDRWLMSTDEMAVGTLDTEWHQKYLSDYFPVWAVDDSDQKAFRLRAGEGLTLKCATNTTTGLFDIFVVFSIVTP
jgi:hypothetical protein